MIPKNNIFLLQTHKIPFNLFVHRKQHSIFMRTISLNRRIVFNKAIIDDTSVPSFCQFIKRIID